MSDPWIDDIRQKSKSRRKGCSCRTRTKIILLVLVLFLVLACWFGNVLAERHYDRQRQNTIATSLPPPPNTTRVAVPPAGGMRVTPCAPSAARPKG